MDVEAGFFFCGGHTFVLISLVASSVGKSAIIGAEGDVKWELKMEKSKVGIDCGMMNRAEGVFFF